MPKYRVDITYNMGMSQGGETYEFNARNDSDAIKKMEGMEGRMLSLIKRNIHCKKETLSRMVAKKK